MSVTRKNPSTKKSATPQLTANLLGAPQLFLDAQPLTVLRRKNRALVYYLAAHPRPTPRENILALFWTDHPRPAAQQILRTMVHDLRQQLGAMLIVESESLAIDPSSNIDLRQFETRLAPPASDTDALRAALELYRGNFLDGFALVDTPAFDDWVAAERERLQILFIRGLTRLAQQYETQRDWHAALGAIDRALQYDPLQEELQRIALRLQYLNGDRPGAIRRYEAFRKLLDDEMGVPPMPETRALYDAIILDTLPAPVATHPLEMRSTTSRPTTAPNQLPFVGRAREMETLAQTARAGKLILIEGEPGIGKTRLAQEFISHFSNALVLTGAAHELEQGLPYQPIIDALRALASSTEWRSLHAQLELAPLWQAELARLAPDLFPTQSPVNSSSEESRMWEALVRLLIGLAHSRDVIFLFDDLHWADSSTLGWLGYLLRHPPPSRLTMLATARTEPAQTQLASLLQTLARQEQLVRFSLDALSGSDLRRLVQQLAPGQPEAISEWLARNTEGNPFFVSELVRSANANSWDAVMQTPHNAVPDSIRALINTRLAHLSNSARRVLDVAAIIGREFDAQLVMRVSTFDEDQVLDAFDELGVASLIQARERGRFAFDHTLTMQIVLQAMSELRQLALHRHIAQALEEIHRAQLDPIAGLIAHHWALADAPGYVAPFAFRAGNYAARLAAWSEAIAFYTQALAAEADDLRRTDIFLALGNAYWNRGDLSQASNAFRSAVELAQRHQDWARLEEAHLSLNRSFYTQGHYAEAIAVARELRQTCPPDLTLAAEFMWGMALSLQSTHPIEAEFHLREAEKLLTAPRSFPSQLTPATLKYQLAGALGQQGKLAEAIALYRQALALVNENENALDLQRRILLYNSLAYYLHLENDPAAIEYARAGLELARENGSLTHQAYLLSTSGEIALAQNNWASAQTCFADGLRIAEQLNIPERIAGLTANLGRAEILRGDAPRARELLQAALHRADQIGASHLAVRIRIWLAPLLSSSERTQRLSEAHALAEASGYARLLDEIAQLEQAHT